MICLRQNFNIPPQRIPLVRGESGDRRRPRDPLGMLLALRAGARVRNAISTTGPRPARPPAPNIDAIPAELRERNQWVTWAFVEVGGMWTKVPYCPGFGSKASATDPRTWRPLDAVLAHYREGSALDAAPWDGIGYVFSADDPYCGIDLDRALDESGDVKPWAAPYVERLASYGEVSPSGTGVKLIIRGQIPGGDDLTRHRTKTGPDGDFPEGGEIEIYSRELFFTITDKHMQTIPTTIEDRAEALTAVHSELFPAQPTQAFVATPCRATVPEDHVVLEKARSARNGDRFRQLFDLGNVELCRGDHSAADLALCGSIAFWVGPDPERIDRIFRQSALVRPKWINRPTYRSTTIRTAIAGRTEFHQWGLSGNGRTSSPIEIPAESPPPSDRPAVAGPIEVVEALPVPEPSTTTTAPATTGNYRSHRGRLEARTEDDEGNVVWRPLANFTAGLVEARIHDDGSGEVYRRFALIGRTTDGRVLGPIEIDANKYNSGDWITEAFGHEARPARPGRGGREAVTAAILDLSHNAPIRTVYAHTGWRRIGDSWHYLSASGTIGAAGLDASIVVETGDGLQSFRLPPPPEGDELKRAVRTALGLVRFGQVHRAGSRALAAVLAAYPPTVVVEPANFSVQFLGKTGTRKTSVAAIAQAWFGPEFTAETLPADWTGTAVGLQALLHTAKDALVVIDNYVPSASRGEADRQKAVATRLFQSAGDKTPRLRGNRDGTLARAKPQRGSILSTGEDRISGESTNGRTLQVWFQPEGGPDRPGTVDLEVLTEAQGNASQGAYALATAGYVQWLAPRLDEVKASQQAQRDVLRREASDIGDHTRAPGIIARLAAGFGTFLDFAMSIGAVHRTQAEDFRREVWRGLIAAVEAAGADQAESSPPDRFLRLLGSSIASGAAHIAHIDGGEPPSDIAEACGWKTSGHYSNPSGVRVGWTDGVHAYINRDVAFAHVAELARQTGEVFTTTSGTLWRLLDEAGKIAEKDPDGRRLTIRKCVGGGRQVLIAVHLADIIGEPETPTEPPMSTPTEAPTTPPSREINLARLIKEI